jgi:hypothetical protein
MTLDFAKQEASRRTGELETIHYIYQATPDVDGFIVTARMLSGKEILHTYWPSNHIPASYNTNY